MDVTNYRSIAKQSSMAKVFESFITDELFMKINHLIVPEQHGFFRTRSTSYKSGGVHQIVQSAVDRKIQVEVIYTDLEKAFDRVNHRLLIHTLRLVSVK